RSCAPRDLPPFPTRRSSDLAALLSAGSASAQNAPMGSAGTSSAFTTSRQTAGTPPGGPGSGTVGAAGNRPGASMGTLGTGTPTKDRKSTRLNSSHVAISYAV